MVINIGALKGGDDDARRAEDIRARRRGVQGRPGALQGDPRDGAALRRGEGARLRAAMKAGADFVKTSTGFSSGGATVEDVALMARTVPPAKLGVKASGGIRSYADVREDGRGGRDPRRLQQQREDPRGGAGARGDCGRPRRGPTLAEQSPQERHRLVVSPGRLALARPGHVERPDLLAREPLRDPGGSGGPRRDPGRDTGFPARAPASPSARFRPSARPG